MILKKMDMKSFSLYCQKKRIACYGIGKEFERIIHNYVGYEWEERIEYLVDSNIAKTGSLTNINGVIRKIISLEQFLRNDLSDVIVLVTCTSYADVVEQLNRIEQLTQIECYLFHFMFGLSEDNQITIRQRNEMLIPPVIHYCWFGGKELPDFYKKCIDSWYKYCPDYEIKKWDETNCNISETEFTRQAYEVGKLGFVPDYFRLKIIFEHGGIYLDTDVEVIKNLDDLRYNEAFCGLQFPGEINLGLGFGAKKGNDVVKTLIQRYEKMYFIKEDGSYDETISPIYQTTDLRQMGMRYGTKLQNVSGMTVYPIEVLSPQNINTGEQSITEYSYAIHHYTGSWVTGKRLEEKKRRQEKVARIQAMFQ